MSKQPKEPGRISFSEWLKRTKTAPPDPRTVIRFRDDAPGGQERISDYAFFAPAGVAQRAGFRLTTPNDAEVWRAGRNEPLPDSCCWTRLTRFPWSYDPAGNRYAASVIFDAPADLLDELNGADDEALLRMWRRVVESGREPELTGPIPWSPTVDRGKGWFA